MAATAHAAETLSPVESYLARLTRFGIKPGLERIRRLLADVDHPHRGYPVALVGGVNGKGSVVAFLSAMLQAAGLRVGRYTSPHLYSYRERICINDEPISAAALEDCFAACRDAVDRAVAGGEQPTEFEVGTLLALRHFADEAVDIAVVEVGLGGRWDATNATDPIVSAVTNISRDHIDRLGDSEVAIAAEKAAIARGSRPLVTAATQLPVLDVLRQHCEKVGASLIELREGEDYRLCSHSPWQWDLVTTRWRLEAVASSLAGEFQGANLAVAAAMADCLAAVDFPVTGEHVAAGAAAATLPGRLQLIPGEPQILLDGANNVSGAAALRRHLETRFAGRPLTLVVGVSADKDVEGMLAQWVPLAETIICTAADNPRACAPERLAESVRSLGGQPTVVTPAADALQRALAGAPQEGVVCVTGSFFLLGDLPRPDDLGA